MAAGQKMIHPRMIFRRVDYSACQGGWPFRRSLRTVRRYRWGESSKPVARFLGKSAQESRPERVWTRVGGFVPNCARQFDTRALLGEGDGHARPLGQDFSGMRKRNLPFARIEHYNSQSAVPETFTPHPTFSVRQYSFGASYRPIQQVVFKMDYQLRNRKLGFDETQLNFGVGFMY